MFRKDFILRIIDELAKMIAALLGFIEKKDFSQASAIYTKSLNNVFGQDEEQLLSMSAKNILKLLEDKHGKLGDGLEKVARFLSVGGDLHLNYGNNELAWRSYVKAIELYMLVDQQSQSFSIDRQVEMEKIEAVLKDL